MERVFRGVDIFLFCFFHGRMDAWMHEWNGMGLLFHFILFSFIFIFIFLPLAVERSAGSNIPYTVDVVGAGVRVVIQGGAVLGSWDAGRDGFCSVLLQPSSRERVPVCDARLRCSA